MSDEKTNAASGNGGDATTRAPYAQLGCSKSESATPLTDALLAKCKARPTDGSGSRDGGWGAADIADFLRHSRKLEIALGVAIAALSEVSDLHGDGSIRIEFRASELVGRMQRVAEAALDSISTLNPTGLRCAGLGAHKQDPVVLPPDSENQSERK